MPAKQPGVGLFAFSRTPAIPLNSLGQRDSKQGAVHRRFRVGEDRRIWSGRHPISIHETGAWEGNTVVVGSFWDDISANLDQGSVYVFERRGNLWVEQAKLTASDGSAGDLFGLLSVAVRSHTVVVGAPLDDISTNVDQGSAYVFR